ncbi:MAG: hypothetical protein ABJA64_02830 [Candidatus Saccharibacteria bacterium]
MQRRHTVSSAIESPSIAGEWPSDWDSFTTTQYAHHLNSHEVRRRLDYFFDHHLVSSIEGVILQRHREDVPDNMYATVLLPIKRYGFEAFDVRGTEEYGYEATFNSQLSRDRVLDILNGDSLTVFQHPFSLEPTKEPLCEMVRAAEDRFLGRRLEQSQQSARDFGRRLLSVH